MQNNNYNKLLICGCDETGRGSLAFEVYAAACILDPCRPIEGLADSKKLSPRKREFLAEEIKNYALAWCLGSATLEEIELLNIHNASLLAMKRAIEGLAINPDKVLVDGLHVPDIRFDAEAIVKGDDKIPAISAASILAKVARDKEMVRYHALYPQYGFNHHKGYFTKEHADALRLHGPCPIHRKGYAPVKQLLEENTYEQSVMFTDCSEDNR